LVVVVGAVEVDVVSGATVGTVPAAWAKDSESNAVPATNASNANAEISAFMRELLGQNNDALFFSHSWGVQQNITVALVATYSRTFILSRLGHSEIRIIE
jgi:hypothetical protein